MTPTTPLWLRFLVAGLAILGSVAAALCGVTLIALRWQPDTGHGEDIGRMFALAAILPIFFIAVLVALGTGTAGLMLGRPIRRAAVAALAVAALAVGCSLAAWMA